MLTNAPNSEAMKELIDRAEALVQAVTFDDSGSMGRGGNGGLISRETIRKTDELRLALFNVKHGPVPDVQVPSE